MSVYALPRPAVMPGVARACAELDVAREVPLFGVESSDLESGVGALAVLESQAASLRLALLAEADRRAIADQNAVPFCGYHHRRAHDERFNLRNHAEHGWRLHPRR